MGFVHAGKSMTADEVPANMDDADDSSFPERGSPPQLRRGGRDIKKKTAQPPLMERTGWCW